MSDVKNEILDFMAEEVTEAVVRFSGSKVGYHKYATLSGTLSRGQFSGVSWTYEGEVEDGFLQGQGKMIWSNGNEYEGGWLKTKRHGKGKYSWSNKSWYEGEYKNGRCHGKGKLVYHNGDFFEGYWENGKRHGEGKYTYAASGKERIGRWENDKYVN